MQIKELFLCEYSGRIKPLFIVHNNAVHNNAIQTWKNNKPVFAAVLNAASRECEQDVNRR